jgi:hypothetical protein
LIFLAEEKYIQFVANYDDWVSIKKLKIEQGMDPRTIMEFLASLTMSVDKKVEENLRKLVDLKQVDDAINAVFSGGKGAAAINEALAAVNSSKVNTAINAISAKEEWQKGEQKEIQDFCKVYAMRVALKKCNLAIDYSGIEIPGMKRVMKTKA